jgi:transposase
MAHLVPLLERIEADESLPALARELFAIQAKEYAQLQARIGEIDVRLTTWHRVDECSQRLAKIPGVGPIGAVLLRMKTPQPELFQSGRQFAAWIGLTPKDHSTAGKVRLGVITRAADEGLRSVLVVGATAVIQHAQRSGKASPWLVELLRRKSPKLAAVALANKTARIAWKMMVTGKTYVAKSAPAARAGTNPACPEVVEATPCRPCGPFPVTAVPPALCSMSYGSASTANRYVTLLGPHHAADARGKRW